MNRRTMIAALAVIGPASIAVAPSFAQDRSLPLDARMATERASGATSGAMPTPSSPSPSVRLGTKRKATSEEGPQLQSQKAARPLSLSRDAAPNLPAAK
jgi:hypothetical protein